MIQGLQRIVSIAYLLYFLFLGKLLDASHTPQHRLNQNADNTEPDIKSILSQMTLREKLAQMVQIDIALLINNENNTLSTSLVQKYLGLYQVGSVLNIPNNTYFTYDEWNEMLSMMHDASKKVPIVYGLDSIHGANYIPDVSITPQPINIASTFDRNYAYRMGLVSGNSTPPAWLFSPLLGLAIQPKWPRVYETFGEDPYVVSEMASEVIRGIQKNNKAACGKHFIGYSDPKSGYDRDVSWIPRRHLYNTFLPPWEKAVKNGVKSVMTSYNEYDGIPNTINGYAIDYILRHRLGFDGLVVTDYREIYNLVDWHGVATNLKEALTLSLKETSIDMYMAIDDVLSFLNVAEDVVKEHNLTSRIDSSVMRILKFKKDLGLFSWKPSSTSKPSRNDTELLEMSRDSIILVKNHKLVLPIFKPSNKKNMLITGPASNSLAALNGGWTGTWQGLNKTAENDFLTYGSSLLQAANLSKSSHFELHYSCGVDFNGEECADDSLQAAINISHSMDYILIAIGEPPYAEKPGDIHSLALPSGQYELVQQIRKDSPDVKIILIYVGGRPRLLHDIVHIVDAILLAFLPGPHGGQALMDIIAGNHNPSAKLPITYPMYDAGAPYYHALSHQCTSAEDPMEYKPCDVQWPFGYGLSYSHFFYSKLSLSNLKLSYQNPTIDISIHVKNTGSIPGSDVMFLYLFYRSRNVSPSYKKLVYFEKTQNLKSFTSHDIKYTLSLEELRFVGLHDDTFPVFQNGMTFRIGVGNDVDCRFRDDPESSEQESLCSDPIVLDVGKTYIDACDTACQIWNQSACFYSASNETCIDMCIEDDDKEGWGWDYVHCIDNVVKRSTVDKKDEDMCDAMTSRCRNIFSNTHTKHHNKITSAPTDADVPSSFTISPSNSTLISPEDFLPTPTAKNTTSKSSGFTPQTTATVSEGSTSASGYSFITLAFVGLFIGLVAVVFIQIKKKNDKETVNNMSNDLEFTQVRDREREASFI